MPWPARCAWTTRSAATCAPWWPRRRGAHPSHLRYHPGRSVPASGQLLETVRPSPAYVLSRTNDLLAANPGGIRLMPGMSEWPARQRNAIRYTFLHPAARSLWTDWEQKARVCVAQLRAVAGSDPDAPDLAALVGELIVKSPDFNRHWERYEVRRAGAGEKIFQHPDVGPITLTHEVLDVNRSGGQRIVVYLASPGSPDHDAITLLDLAGSTTVSGPGMPMPDPRGTACPG